MTQDHPLHLAAEILPRYVEKGRVLDCPSGRGDLARRLSELGYEVEAGDARVPERFEVEGIPYHRVDLNQTLPWPGESFDAVTCIEGMEHLENPFRAMRELARVLRPGGVLLLSMPNYSHFQKRISFLLTGHLAKPKPHNTLARPLPLENARHFHGHVTQLTWPALRYVLQASGFAVVEPIAASRRSGTYWMWPLVWFVGLRNRLRGDHERLHQDIVNDPRVVLGGRHLVVVARRVDSMPSPDIPS